MDYVASDSESLMFLKGDKIKVLAFIDEGVYLVRFSRGLTPLVFGHQSKADPMTGPFALTCLLISLVLDSG